MRKLIIKSNLSIKDAMKALEKSSKKCLFIVNSKNELRGTITDGDIRRAILDGNKFSNDISSAYNPKPIKLIDNNYDTEQVKELLKKNKIDLIPIVDSNNVLIDYISSSNIDNVKIINNNMNVPVVIMAGGKGTRLEPFTKILPKPLVPIHEKPIIEHIINNFTQYGCNHFYLTVNYKNRILKAYFDEFDPEYRIDFINENQPLGTAGSLHFLAGKIKEPFFISNCDIIIKTDYSKLFEFHKKGKNDLTLVASAKEYQIPYGACELKDNGQLLKIKEKPSYDLLINTGLYVINPNILQFIPKDKKYHITDLIDDLLNQNLNIGVYPISDDAWIDIGQWAEYKKAVDRL